MRRDFPGLLVPAFLLLLGPATLQSKPFDSLVLAQGRPGGGKGPFLILHDWHGNSPVATPTFVRDHLDFLESQPFDGMALYLRSPDHSVNVTASVMSETVLTREKISEVLKPVAKLPF